MTLWLVLALYVIAVFVFLMLAGHRSPADARPNTRHAETRAGARHILVVGATGGTGRELVKQALARGLEVTALARNPANFSLTHARLKVARGDVLEPDSLVAALRGCDAVVCALGHKRFLGPSSVLSKGTRHLLQAMRDQGIGRLVATTSLGLGTSAGRLGLVYSLFTLPFVLPFYFADKARQERLIAGSDLDWVIVRPGALTGGTASGRYRHGPKAGDYLLTRGIARADVAAFMLDQLDRDMYLRTAVGISG